MAHRASLSLRGLVALSFIVLGATAVACGGNVEGGSGNGGSGGSGSGGSGGSDSNPKACTLQGSFSACFLPGDPAGMPSGGSQCEPDANGALTWGPCEPNSSAESTPLVLSFDGAPVTVAASAGAFDLDGTMSVVTDWPTATTPWLTLDRNGNGAVDDGSELFGSMTVLAGGTRAANGFVALAELDANGDGRITPEDPAWSSLRLWSDRNGDRASSAGELASLDARGVTAIDLGYTSVPRCDTRRNCEIERATFPWVDAAGVGHTGAVVDVHLHHQ